MKLLLVNKAYHPHLGGVETVVRQLALGMTRAGHEVVVLCFGERTAVETLEGIRIHRVRPLFRVGSAPVGFSFFWKYRRLSKWADGILFQSPNPMGELSFLCSPTRKCTVAVYQGDAVRPEWLLPAYDMLMRVFLRHASRVVVSNPNLPQSSRVLSKLSPGVTIIPIGVDLNRFVVSEFDVRTASNLWEGLTGFKVMFAGRLVYYKGTEVLLESVLRLRNEGLDVSVFLVGDGPLREKLERFILDNSLERHAKIIPPQPEEIYTALFEKADCFVLPSLYPVEAFGIVLLEAMASGLPVVSTELGTGTSWINRDGETGLVTPPGDVGALSEAICFLMEHPEERQRMQQNARERVEDLFSESAMLSGYERLFSECGNLCNHMCE